MVHTLPDQSAYDSEPVVDEILEQYDTYIVDLARKKLPRSVVRSEMLGDEIDELVQKVRVKLWIALQKKHILNLRAYISCIVYTEVIEMVRKYQSTSPLPLDENCELYQGNVIVTLGEGMQDPAYEVEEKEAMKDYTKEYVQAVLKLPPRQQLAMICLLKDGLDDVLPLIDAFKDRAMNIEEVNWPVEKEKLQSLRASVSVARKKLSYLKSKFSR